MRKRRVDQFSPSVPERDAIGHEVIALDRILRSLGYETHIFAEESSVDRGIRNWARYADSPGDVLLVHYSHGSDAYGPLFRTAPESILLYHNNAPIQFMAGLDESVLRAARQGFAELPNYAGVSGKVVAHSELSASDLGRAGYEDVHVIPYLLNEDLFELVSGLQGFGTEVRLRVDQERRSARYVGYSHCRAYLVSNLACR